MNTPPGSVGEYPTAPEYNQILQGLEKVLQQRAEATPEPSFADDISDENYQYLCEQLHRHFDDDQLREIRERVKKPEYWECEANSYKNAAIARGWEMSDGKRPERIAMTNDWKEIAHSYQYLLHELGFSAEEIEDVRLRIESQRYWKIEDELLEPLSKLKERELIEQWRKEDEKKNRVSGEKTSVKEQYGRRSAKPPADSTVASRTRGARTRARNRGAGWAGVPRRKLARVQYDKTRRL